MSPSGDAIFRMGLKNFQLAFQSPGDIDACKGWKANERVVFEGRWIE